MTFSIQRLSPGNFEELADLRLKEAKGLLDLEMWVGAYYLAGYAVELALKACIIKRLRETDEFPEAGFSASCDTHSIEKLVILANLEGPRKAATDSDSALMSNWATARDWSEQLCYHKLVTESEAKALLSAIADDEHGVLTWIKAQW